MYIIPAIDILDGKVVRFVKATMTKKQNMMFLSPK